MKMLEDPNGVISGHQVQYSLLSHLVLVPHLKKYITKAIFLVLRSHSNIYNISNVYNMRTKLHIIVLFISKTVFEELGQLS